MRKYLLAGLAVALLLGGALFALLGPWPCRVTRANCERIKPGMTRAQVEKVFGGPEGDYRTRPGAESDPGIFMPIPTVTEEVWWGDVGHVYVTFTPGGVVALAKFVEAAPNNPGPVAVATWRLKRLKERWLP
jgi:hypothetical protein